MRRNFVTMLGEIDRCWLIALRADLREVREVLPPELEPVTFGGFAFLNVVVSHLRQMRPSPLPKWIGMSYWHVAYRIYARFTPPDGEAVEGLYFLRSDASSPLMVAAGNLLTDFRFHRASIAATGTTLTVASPNAPLDAVLSDQPRLAEGSPFPSLETAGDFLRYKPAGISVNARDVDVMRITRDEHKWRYRLRGLENWNLPYLERFKPVPEAVYEVGPIEYRWNRAEHFRRRAR